MQANDSLEGAARRRSEMETAMRQVEHMAAAPSANRSWIDELTRAVRQLEIALNNHIVEVETPSGLLDQIVDTAPRLQRRADETRAHHTEMVADITSLLESLAGSVEQDPPPIDTIRTATLELLGEIARHRQQGADMIFEAYDVDIGGY